MSHGWVVSPLSLLTALVMSCACCCAEQMHGIMIDAGSTGSRLHVYEWAERVSDSPRSHVTPPMSTPVTQKDWTKRTNQSLSSFALDPTSVGQSLRPLIDFAKETVDEEQWATTPLYLGATAGMRVLPPGQRAAVLQATRDFLSDPEQNPFQFRRENARVISGEEEGAFGFITVNYLLDSELKPPFAGALDMGGASTQITFSFVDPLEHFFGLRVQDRLTPLYTKSYLRYGLVQSMLRVVEASAAEGTTVSCWPVGYSEQFTTSDGRKLTLNGTGDATGCRARLVSLFYDEPCMTPPCTFNGVYQPHLPQGVRFYAFSGFGAVTKRVGLKQESTLAEIDSRAAQICATSYAGLIAELGLDKYLQALCLDLLYFGEILRAYGFQANDTTLIFTEQISQGKQGAKELGWTLGAMLYQANMLPFAFPQRSQDHEMVLAVAVTATVVIGALLVAVVVLCRKLAAMQLDYQASSAAPLLNT